MIKRDITDEVCGELRAEAERRNARFYVLERDTLMLRADDTTSQFFCSEQDAVGQMLQGKKPMRWANVPTARRRTTT